MKGITTETADSKEQYKPRKIRFFILGVVLFSLTIFIVSQWVSQVKIKEPLSPPNTLNRVKIIPVSLSDNKIILTASGFVSANESQITAEVTGKIVSVSPNFAIGQQIKKGDILVKIDKQKYLATLASARAKLTLAKSNYAQEQAKSRQAKTEADRLKIKGSDLLFRIPQLSVAKENINDAEAQLALAKKDIKKTEVRAPFNAIVKSRKVSIGDNVGASSVLGQLVNTDAYTTKLTLSSVMYHLVSVNSQVELSNTHTGAKYLEKINRFDPGLSADRTIGAYIDIDNPLQKKEPLLLNSYLTARITGKLIPDSMWINNQASVGNQFVWTKKNDNTLHKSAFTLFYRDKNRSLVTFNKAILGFVSRPKDSFFEGEKITTEVAKRKKSEIKQ